ncbi:FAD-dependent monooxygenase [Tenacibaculum sp. nBUS_03]|uniref:FAD-dependent monooxygenase n=1 Tax=Tenacibaculum sp. nBUS_03 TaxID=3395320 RepID=UPI003EBDD52D
MTNIDFDVIIAGCGPTGATFANYLGKSNLKILIFDKESEIIDFPRAVHIDEDVIRIFQELELYEDMMENSIKSFENYKLVTKQDKTLFEFQPNSSVSEDIPSCNWILQPEIEKHLRKGFSQYSNVTFLNNTEFTDFKQNENFVTVNLVHNESGTLFNLTTKYLIGADGANSFIRQKLNIPLINLGKSKSWMVMDTEYQGDAHFSEDHKQFCIPEQPITYVNGVKNHFRWEFMLRKENEMLSEEDLQKKMLVYLEKKYPVKDFKIIRKKKYTFHSLIAKKWRVQNIFLAGDSAHQMPPFLGQGMCSGIKDAKNLSWKISVACNNTSQNSDLLLDTYFTERKPQVKKIIKLATIFGGFIQYSNPFFYRIRDSILRLINILPSTPVDKLIDKHLYSIPVNSGIKKNKLSGRRVPQPIVLHNDHYVYLDKVIKDTWAIIYRNLSLDEISPNLFNKIKLVKDHPNKNEISSIIMNNWMDHNNIDFAIIRPDKFIFTAGKNDTIEEVLKYSRQYLKELYCYN